jgi:SAM-dependent methyltransferase
MRRMAGRMWALLLSVPRRFSRFVSIIVGVFEDLRLGPRTRVDMECAVDGPDSDVALFWSGHTVKSDGFRSAWESTRYLEWRFSEYPMFKEFMGLWGDHVGETVLDYGCGPGNDTTGFALYSGASAIIGADVSPTALLIAQRRLARHRVEPEKVRLVLLSEAGPKIPLEDASVGYVHSAGVIHHTSWPDQVLSELHRVLRPGGRASIMVYNADSVWRHLYVIWVRMVRDGDLAGTTPEEAFRICADCGAPQSRYYAHGQFETMCNAAGFEASFVGGYPSLHGELDLIKTALAPALADERLPADSRAFLESLEFDERGYPVSNGSYAGLGGCYRLRK